MEHTSVLWIQIPVADLERAWIFYKEVFNFNFFYEDLNNIPHAIFKEDETGKKPINGALVEIKDVEIGRGPVLFFDATGKFEMILENVEKNGGKIITEKTLIKKRLDGHRLVIPATYIDKQPGYFAHILDSEGNRIGLYGAN